MKTFIANTGLGIGLAAIVIAATGLAGCASHKQEAQKPASASEIGAEMQKDGVMSQSDYIRIRELGHQVSRTHTITEADLNWTLHLLASAKYSIVRTRAFSTLSEIRPMSSGQKAKILPAIAPYLNSSDTLDQTGAQRVQKAAQAA